MPKKYVIDYSDGRYFYTPVGAHESDYKRAGKTVVEVPDDIAALWDAISKAAAVVQQQLCAFDNAWHDEQDRIANDARGPTISKTLAIGQPERNTCRNDITCCLFHSLGGHRDYSCSDERPNNGGFHARSCAYHDCNDCTCQAHKE